MSGQLNVLGLFILCASAQALNNAFPLPDPNFNVGKWLGRWYMISRILPCNWAGSRDFTDFQMYQCMEGKNVITEDLWKSEGFCSSTFARFSPVHGLNGAFTSRDQIGGAWNAEVRVVLLDHKTGININWGCVQRELPRFKGEPPRCKDAWVSVASRYLNINPYAKALAYRVLSSIGIRPSDLIPMQFSGKPCKFTGRVCPIHKLY